MQLCSMRLCNTMRLCSKRWCGQAFMLFSNKLLKFLKFCVVLHEINIKHLSKLTSVSWSVNSYLYVISQFSFFLLTHLMINKTNEDCGCWVIVALTERYRRLRDRIVDKSWQSPPVPVMSTVVGLESWLNKAERVLMSRQKTTPASIAELESAIRQQRVCVFST